MDYRSDTFRLSLSYLICHKAASSVRLSRLFLVGVLDEHGEFFMISGIEMKGDGRCKEKKTAIATNLYE